MCAGQPIELGTLISRRAGKEASRGAKFGGVFVTASSVVTLGLARLHQGVKVEFVGVPLAVYFGHDVLVIVVAQTA